MSYTEAPVLGRNEEKASTMRNPFQMISQALTRRKEAKRAREEALKTAQVENFVHDVTEFNATELYKVTDRIKENIGLLYDGKPISKIREGRPYSKREKAIKRLIGRMNAAVMSGMEQKNIY